MSRFYNRKTKSVKVQVIYFGRRFRYRFSNISLAYDFTWSFRQIEFINITLTLDENFKQRDRSIELVTLQENGQTQKRNIRSESLEFSLSK